MNKGKTIKSAIEKKVYQKKLQYEANVRKEKKEAENQAKNLEAKAIQTLKKYKAKKYEPSSSLTSDQKQLHLALVQVSKLYNNKNFYKAVKLFWEFKDFWLRDPFKWKPTQYNLDMQFNHLVQYIFAKYDMPFFMTSIWKSKINKYEHIEWYLDLANGVSVKKLRNFPEDLTARMRYIFLNTPSKYDIPEALWRARILGLKGDKMLIYAVLRSPIVVEAERNSATGYKDTKFWISVIHLFINNPMLDRTTLTPLCDYLQEIKYKRYRGVVDGVVTDVEPPYPDFQLKGRNPMKLIDDMEKWHTSLTKTKAKGKDLRRWLRCNLPEFEFEEGTNNNTSLWQITEITTAAQLSKEGRELRHCVMSFTHSCSIRATSIWSLTRNRIKKITIQVNLTNYTIVQCRGTKNRLPNTKEARVIQEWADKTGITSRYYH